MSNKDEWVTGRVTIAIGGHPLDMSMTVPANPVRARRMLPILRQMTNSLVGIGIDGVEAEGKKISCKAGCGACCRQPVPLSETEIYELAEIVEKMPEPRRTQVKKRFRDAFEHFAAIGWFERLDNVASLSKEVRHKVALEYFKESIPCPLLEEESCSIHEDRPLACREYLVTSPAEYCSKPTAETIDMVPIPAKPSAAWCSVSRARTVGTSVKFVPLIAALEVARQYEEDETLKSGEEWMADFFRELTHSEIPDREDSGKRKPESS